MTPDFSEAPTAPHRVFLTFAQLRGVGLSFEAQSVRLYPDGEYVVFPGGITKRLTPKQRALFGELTHGEWHIDVANLPR